MTARWLLLLVVLAACSQASTPAPTVREPDVPAAYRTARLAPGHRDHVAYGAVACTACHGEAGFAPPAAEVCARCHEQHTPLHPERPGGLSALSPPPVCVDCHSFTEQLTTEAACMRCHRQPQGLFADAVGIHAPRSTHDELDLAAEPTMPTVPTAPTDPAASHAALDQATVACSDCHAPHQRPSLDPKPCQSCHREQRQVRHAGVGGDGCQDCHSVHQREHAAADRCIGCHAKGRPAIDAARALAPGHDLCTTCHKPHSFDREGVAQCKTCHDKLPVLAEARGLAQGHRCAGCHDPHAAAAPRACASCHSTGPRAVSLHHPPVARRVDLGAHRTPAPASAATACTGCHPVHDGALAAAGGAAALACASCHTSTVSHAPGAECATCHPPHGAAAPTGTALCATCHQQHARTVAATGHSECAKCHDKPGHRPAAPPPRCETCHTPVASKVNPGHATCTDCHAGGPHAPRAPVAACASCHQAQASTAPGGHQRCAQCHSPHDGALLPQATCESCHKDRTRGHGEPPSQGQRAGLALSHRGPLPCSTCHRAHGPKGVAAPPACTTCHTKTALPRLHSVYWHQQRCENCHAAHEPTGKSDRATCVACHKDRAAHEPTAKVCATCHPFAQ